MTEFSPPGAETLKMKYWRCLTRLKWRRAGRAEQGKVKQNRAEVSSQRRSSPQGHLTPGPLDSHTVPQPYFFIIELLHYWAVCTEWSFLLHHTPNWRFLLAFNWLQWPSVDRNELRIHQCVHMHILVCEVHIHGSSVQRRSQNSLKEAWRQFKLCHRS